MKFFATIKKYYKKYRTKSNKTNCIQKDTIVQMVNLVIFCNRYIKMDVKKKKELNVTSAVYRLQYDICPDRRIQMEYAILFIHISKF